jgi:membrane protein implicated in regulation of membrane protease activity
MAYTLALILILAFAVIWIAMFFNTFLHMPFGIIGIACLVLFICILIKLAYDRMTNKDDNHYDKHVDK